jgi:hypothetical protein
MSAVVALLRQRLAELDAPALFTPGLPTGIDALDAALSSRGLPRGRLTEIAGPRGAGKTTLVRQIVARTVASRGWVAIIDASRTLAPRDWAHLGIGEGEGMWMIRPPTPSKGAWCADVLLRSGAFAMVVLDGAPPIRRSVATRLVRLARESDAALVITSEDDTSDRGTPLGGAVRLRVEERDRKRREQRIERKRRGGLVLAVDEPPPEHMERRTTITVEKGGGRHTVEVGYAVRMARRLCTHPEVPDRRGVGRRSRAPEAGGPPSTRTLPRKRRCAESDFGRHRQGCGC